MSTRKMKLVVSIRITAGTSLWMTEQGGSTLSPPTEIPLTAGLYYISGDGTSSDLTKMISTALAAAGANSLVQIGLSATDGVITHKLTSGSSESYDWSDPSSAGRSAEYVQSALRFSLTYQITGTSVQVGSRIAQGLFYPDSYIQADLEIYRPRGAVFVPDNGNAQVLNVALRKEYSLTIRSTGFPRTSGWSEYQIFVDWHSEACSGRPFRFYSDLSVTTAYTTSSRWGYQTMTLDPQPLDMQPEAGNYYKHFLYDIKAYEYS